MSIYECNQNEINKIENENNINKEMLLKQQLIDIDKK
jgi:hypothetical protein